jgi:uncharacterized membrane protein YkoI
MMNQRMTLVLAGALTAFVVVLMAGVGLTVAAKSLTTTNAAAQQSQAPDAAVQPQSPASNAINVQLTPGQAAAVARGVAPNAKLVSAPQLVNFQGTVAYEVGLNQGNVYVDANSGKVLLNSAATNSAAPARIGGGERSGERGNTQQRVGDNDD